MAAVAAMFAAYPAYACSSVVISGKVTPDGRPLLWKHRDSDYLQNSVKFFKGEKYSFIAIVNSVEDDPTDVWMGVNSAGFAIMNTQSFNLVDVAPGEERGAANGRIMRRALEICATVEDFHHFLDTLAKPSMIEASLGVIDAQGGAQMLEVDYYKYVVYDANDPAVAANPEMTEDWVELADFYQNPDGNGSYWPQHNFLSTRSAADYANLTPYYADVTCDVVETEYKYLRVQSLDHFYTLPGYQGENKSHYISYHELEVYVKRD